MEEKQRAEAFGKAIAASAFPHMKAGDIKKRALGTICASIAKDIGEFSNDARQVAVETAEAEAKRLLEEDRPKPPENVRALIVWRDSLALDWSGFELVDHITFRLKELTPEENPGYLPSEHATALKTFQAYSDDEQRDFVRTVVEDLYGLIDDDADPYGYPD